MSAREPGEMLQEGGFRLRFAILRDRNHREGHLERARERFEVGMIAGHADHVAVELAETMAAQEIHHAVRQARNHDDDPVALGGVEEMPFEALPRQQRRHRRVEFFGQLAYGESQAFEVDAPEEVAILVVGVLVGGDNIAAESEQVGGDAGYDAGAVDA